VDKLKAMIVRQKVLILAIVLALAALAFFVFAPDSAADTPGCVSHSEVDNMDRLLTVGQVTNRFDTDGWFIATGDNFWRRGYETCWSNDRKVVVWFDLDNGLTDHWDVRDS